MSKFERKAAGQNAARNIDTFAPLISRYTTKFKARVGALRTGMDEEDIRQELSLTFLRCVNSYDESKGASFMNFVISAWYNEMNSLLRKDQRNFETAQTVSGAVMDDDEEEYSLMDAIASDEAKPEELAEAMDLLEVVLGSLSDTARRAVEVCLNPPPAVVNQFLLQMHNWQRVAAYGSSRRATKVLSLNFVLCLMNLTPSQRRGVSVEVGQAFSEVNNEKNKWNSNSLSARVASSSLAKKLITA